jgi:hypothetical protein
MENRILEEQEKKFRQLTAILANLPRPDNKSGFFAVRCGIPEARQSSWSFFLFFDCIPQVFRIFLSQHIKIFTVANIFPYCCFVDFDPDLELRLFLIGGFGGRNDQF